MQTYVTAKALELHRKASKDDPAKVFNTLILYEEGKPFPDLLRCSVPVDKVSEASALVGHNVQLEAEVTIYQGKANLRYLRGKTTAVKAA